MMRATLVSLLLGWLLLGCAFGQQNPTLADVLKRDSIPFHPDSVPHLDASITSYDALNDDQEFVIAYYLVAPRNELRFPLFITRFDKRTGKWQHVALRDLNIKSIHPATQEETQIECIGSVVGVARNGEWYYLNLHWTPSAGCLLILKHDLSVSLMLTGWAVAFFRSGLLLWRQNMVHFASVHPQTLFLYDSVTQKSQQIYPQQNDPFRDDFSTRLERVIDQKKCAEKNWSCEPDDFTSRIGPIEVNDQTLSLAFSVGFDPEGFLTPEEAAGHREWDDDRYVYIYQLNPIRWREFSVYDLKPKFGTDSLKELLMPEKLRQVFATPPP